MSIFDRVVSFSGKDLTRKAVTENLNVLDYDTFFKSTELILENNIPDLLVQFNTILAEGFEGHHYISGLASHFRDLLVCKNVETIDLLEVGELTKDKYIKQTQKTSQEFLLKGIELANTCDLNYKNSKNQRLLVELCLMQLASITFSEKKKNNAFIIPSSYFEQKENIAEKEVKNDLKDAKPKESTKEVVEQSSEFDKTEEPITSESSQIEQKPKIVEERAKILLNQEKKRTSGLSLKSIKAKKEHLIKQMEVVLDEDELPNDNFTEEALLNTWNKYVKKLERSGKFNLASILTIDSPKVNETTIQLEFPNSTNKVELERHQTELLQHIRKELNNFEIDLSISVNEEKQKQFAYTPQEKYNLLKEKNPNLTLLKKTFNLDL